MEKNEKERTSDGNSAQRRSHMKMAFRCRKCRRLPSTESTSMASISESYGKSEREGGREREMKFLVVGLLGSNSKIGAARVSRHFKNTMSRDMDSMEVEA